MSLRSFVGDCCLVCLDCLDMRDRVDETGFLSEFFADRNWRSCHCVVSRKAPFD